MKKVEGKKKEDLKKKPEAKPRPEGMAVGGAKKKAALSHAAVKRPAKKAAPAAAKKIVKQAVPSPAKQPAKPPAPAPVQKQAPPKAGQPSAEVPPPAQVGMPTAEAVRRAVGEARQAAKTARENAAAEKTAVSGQRTEDRVPSPRPSPPKGERVEEKKPKAEAAAAAKQEAAPSKPQAAKPAQAVVRPPEKKAAPKEAPAAPKEAPPKAGQPPAEPAAAPAPAAARKLQVSFPITVKDFAVQTGVSTGELIKLLMKRKIMATINQNLDGETVAAIAVELGFEYEKKVSEEQELLKGHWEKDDPAKLAHRAPVVTLMGHVDHGKTSLLDAIRKTRVVEREAGGITQHIGAYEVTLPKGRVAFLDTPGHEAFTAMRARGAHATDIVVLVVAADDGVMPQTIEAIDHARAAEVPIVVAMNKIDKPGANLDKLKKQLAELDLMPEDWGGKTITVGVSAKTGEGIDALLEMLLLEAELLELRANPEKPARGVVIEAQLSTGKGPVATVLVQNGTLRVGDFVVSGPHFGRVRAMISDRGQRVKEAGPSVPVEILGLSGVPTAGDTFFAVEDEKRAREVASTKQEALREKGLGAAKKVTLEELYEQIKTGEMKELLIVLKADVQGSLEAVRDSLTKLSTGEVKVRIIHGAVGDITDSDIMLAAASNAIVLGFHVGKTREGEERAKLEQVDVRLYQIIYEVTSDVRAALEGLLEPIEKEVFLGRAEVRQVFKVSKVGIIAGCAVTKGKINRQAIMRVVREGEKIHEGKVSSLKRFKDDVREVLEGFECGLAVSDFSDYKPGDVLEAFEIVQTARRLEEKGT